jgi:hypothetical protein
MNNKGYLHFEVVQLMSKSRVIEIAQDHSMG